MFQFWRELRLERQWKDSGPSAGGEDLEGRKDEIYQLRDKSASFGNDLSVSPPPRPTTCLGIENARSRMKTGKKLRIIESHNNTHIVEDCDELPSNSMESVKENTVYEKETPGREEEQEETGKEIQNKTLSSQNQKDFHIQGQNEVNDNESLQSSIATYVSNNGVDYLPNKEESQKQGSSYSESWNGKTNKSCQDGRIGHNNKVSATHTSNKEDGTESFIQEMMADKSYLASGHSNEIQSGTRDRREQHISQVNATSDTRIEETILRVKGGGYGLPSDDLTDVFQTVEEIDKIHRHESTVASNETCKACHTEEWTNCHMSENSSAVPSPTSETFTHSVFQVEKQSQAVSGNEEPSKTASNTNSECSDVSMQDGDLYGFEDKQTQRIGEILETINIALLQHHLKEHCNVSRMNDFRNPFEQTDLSSHKVIDVNTHHKNSRANKDEISCKTNTQSYVSSNEYTSSLNAMHTPLCEDSNNKDSEVLMESNLSGTFQEPEIPSSAQICTTKELITAQRGSEVWRKIPVSVVNIKQPHIEEKQHRYKDESVVHNPQADISHIKICVTPPDPPPRLDHPKGGGSVGYRAIMAARSLGRNTSNKSSVGGGGHATFPSPRSLRKKNPLLTSKFTLGT